MDSNRGIGAEGGESAAPARRWPALAAAAAALAAIGLLILLGSYRGSITPEVEETVPAIGPSLEETALLAVDEFAAAWNRGDAASADGLISEDFDSVALPGLIDSWFTQRDGRSNLTAGIGFLTAVTRLSLGACDGEIAPPDSGATVLVRCEEAVFQGDYLEAVHVNIWEDVAPDPTTGGDAGRREGLVFAVRDDRIIGIDLDTDRFAPQAYCIWAEVNRPELAESRFDLHCRPVSAPAGGADHAAMAAGFVAAGAPLPTRQLADARLAASYVDRFVELLNVADVATVWPWLSTEVATADLPGFPGTGDGPPVVNYLLWSAYLIELDTGECTVELGDGETVVTCPDMTAGGPLFDGPLGQPTRFTVASNRQGNPVARAEGRILAVEPLADSPIPVDEICRRLRESIPVAADVAFTEDCEPDYSRDALAALVALFEQS